MAIALVLVSHSRETIHFGYTGRSSPLQWLADGSVGVNIFFVLSGYLITSILVREFDTIGKLDMKAFYCRRILRIMPAFYGYLLALVALNWLGAIDISGPQFGFAAAHLVNYQQAIILFFHLPSPYTPGYWYVGHFWTLSMEEQFYWIWPVLLLLVLRTRFYAGIALLILAFPAIRVATYYLFPGVRGQVGMMLHSGSDAIFGGCLLAICQARLPQVSKRLLLPSWAVGGVLLYILLIHMTIQQYVPRWYAMMVGTTLMVVAIMLLVANVVWQEEPAWYHHVLGWSGLVFLGRISYSVYLWQQLFMTTMNTSVLEKWPLNLIQALAVGWLSYRFVEQPFIRLKDKYFPAHTKKTIPVAEPTRIPVV